MYSGTNIYDEADKSASTEILCQQSCEDHPECKWWLLDVYTWDKYGCLLKTERDLSTKEAKYGVTFGPKYCSM